MRVVSAQGGKLAIEVDAPEFNDANKAKEVQEVAFAAHVDVGPTGLAETLRNCFTNAAAAGGSALQDVMRAAVPGLDNVAILVSTAAAALSAPPAQALYSVVVGGDYAAHWVTAADADTDGLRLSLSRQGPLRLPTARSIARRRRRAAGEHAPA